MTYKEPLTTTTQPGLITLAGDLGGAATSPTVVSITGASGVVNFASTGNVITWAPATTAPGLAQTIVAGTGTGVGAALTIAAQPGQLQTGGANNNAGGNVILSAGAAGTGGAGTAAQPGQVQFQFGGANPVSVAYNPFSTQATLSTANILNVNSNAQLQLNIAGSTNILTNSSSVQIGIASTYKLGVGSTGVQVGAGTLALAGATNALGLTNASVLPTSLLSGTGSGLVLYSHNGQLEIDGYGINFHNLSQTPGIYQTAAASDVVPQNMTIKPQGPFASAVTNVTSGSVNINFPSPASGTTRGQLNIQENSVSYATIADVAAGTGTAAIWLGSGSSGTNATGANYVLRGSGTSTIVNASGGTLAFSVSSTQIVTINNVGVAIGTNIPNFGNATNALMLASGGTVSTVLIPGTTGLAAYSNNGNFEIDGYGYGFNALCLSPSIYQTAQASDLPVSNITIKPQAPFASATTNKSASSVVVNFPPPVSGGTEGGFVVERGGVFYGSIAGGNNSPSTRAALFLGVGMTPGALNHCLYSDGATVTQLNVPTSGIIQAVTNGASFAWTASARNTQFNNSSIDVGGAAGAIGLTATTANPTTNPTTGPILYGEATTTHFKSRGTLGAITTLAPAGSSGTINSQKQIIDRQIGTCETLSTATPTAILNYTTTTGTAGFITITVVSRATTSGAGVAVGDESTNQYVVSYKTTGTAPGTVALDTTGILSVGTGYQRTTAVAMTVPILTTSVSANVITFLVANQALTTVDSQCFAEIVVC